MAQVGSVARSTVMRQAPRIIWQGEQVQKSQKDQEKVFDWLKKAEQETPPTADTNRAEAQTEASGERELQQEQKRVDGVRYNLWVGTQLHLYSTSDQETKLRNMHEPNHRELGISKVAGRVADMLWPRVQDDVDEALAAAKVMQAKQRIGVEEIEVYEPPEVPHVLPFTTWIRNSKELRESFICNEDTRYKPRMAWYNPNDGMIPSGWFQDGLMGDLNYYKPFVGLRQASQKW